LEIKEGPKIDRKYNIIPLAVPRGLFSSDKKRVYEILDLTRLPMATQNSLMTLLMLPFGALVTTFFRNIIGIKTFGTFTPTLLALATVYADWITATLIFLVVVVIGIWGRSTLPGLKLLKVPRLSLVFTLVAVVMTFTVSALDFANLNPAGHIVLLPMVVLTSIVDRFYTASEEDGMRVAFKRLGWTILVALCCVVFFRWQSLGRALLTYPELHCLTLALILLLGLYGAKKLTDIPFLQFLTEGPKSARDKKSPAVE
jgi:hypothetical protein